MPTWLKRALLLLIAAGVVAAIALAFVPEAVPVDIVEVESGPMQVTVDEDGRTRIRERYVVSAPLSGRLRRVTLDPGDAVAADETIVATIEPVDPALLDARARAEAQARVQAAEAAVRQAESNIERARSTFDYAEDELTRAREARAGGAVTELELSQREMLHRRALEEFRAAEFGLEIARFELEQARAALLLTRPESDGEGASPAQSLVIRSPISGVVLRLLQESMAVVTPGTPLLELGDPHDLEIVVDVLSTDAVRIEPGDEVIVEHWGGDEPLLARVRLVEPSAFTKVSALGVEEQRVNVIADFVSPVTERESLADAFRVEVRIVLWEQDDVVQIPSGALFRSGGQWTVFAVRDGRSKLQPVDIGRQNALAAEIVDGLTPGDQVIVHPSDRVEAGARVEGRESGK